MNTKKILAAAVVLIMVFSFAACGSSDTTASSAEAQKDYITRAQYDEISSGDWSSMTVDDFNKAFGVDGVLDKEQTASFGDGYQVYEWYGKDKVGTLSVLFKDDGSGKYLPSSISPSSDLK